MTAITSFSPSVGPTADRLPATDLVTVRPFASLHPPWPWVVLTSWLAWHGTIVLQNAGGLGPLVASARHQLIGPVGSDS
jgi:hypothetical protein